MQLRPIRILILVQRYEAMDLISSFIHVMMGIMLMEMDVLQLVILNLDGTVSMVQTIGMMNAGIGITIQPLSNQHFKMTLQ